MDWEGHVEEVPGGLLLFFLTSSNQEIQCCLGTASMNTSGTSIDPTQVPQWMREVWDILLMDWWFRNPANQLRLVVSPIIYRVFLHPRLCRISSVNTMRWFYVSKSSEPSCNAYCKLNINKTMVFLETSGSSHEFLSTMHQINRKMLGMAPSSDHQDYHIFSRGNPYKPLFVTVTGRGPYPRYMHLGLRLRQQILHQTRFPSQLVAEIRQHLGIVLKLPQGLSRWPFIKALR